MERCEALQVLRDHKIRVTAGRQALLKEVFRRDDAFSAAELHRATEGVDLATVYRFLNLLVDRGIARSLHGPQGEQFFEKACPHNPAHPHFICRRCGSVFCLPPAPLDVALPGDGAFLVEETSLIVRGLCPDCRKP